MNVLGIMSGTSIDSVDYALCSVSEKRIELRALWTATFPKELRDALHEAARGDLKSWAFCQLHHDLGRFYAKHADRAGRRAMPKPELVGLHGQTVFHNPNRKTPATFQLGEPAYLVEKLRVPVVNNFRVADLAAGGQGAPLATAFHQFVFGARGKHVCVNNLGGISNVTSIDWRDRARQSPAGRNLSATERHEQSETVSKLIFSSSPREERVGRGLRRGEFQIKRTSSPRPSPPSDGGEGEFSPIPRVLRRSQNDAPYPGGPRVLAFDTGPANMLIDFAVRHFSSRKKHFDKNGAWAKRGKPSEDLLARWLRHPYFRLPPPKSTGRELFGEPFFKRAIQELRGLSRHDVAATFTELTARSMELNYRLHLPSPPDKIILAGGGAANPSLVHAIQQQFSTEVLTSDQLGWPVEAIEPAAFALLAYLRVNKRPGNLPGTTGANRPVLCGQISEV